MGDRTDVGGGDVATFVPPEAVAGILSVDTPDTPARLGAFATANRLNALGMIQLAGSGHIGSSFSSLDVVSWLLGGALAPDDVYFSSKGHDVPGLYAALVGLGRLPFTQVTRLRRLGGLPGHPDVGTPGIPFNTGSLGMGISKAKGLALADRLAGRSRRIVVLTGDGELQEGQVWESLAGAARDRLLQLTVIVDHNGLQSDLPVAQVNDLGPLDERFRAFGWDVRRVDGHDMAALAAAFDAPRTAPRVIVADTVKSRGVSFLEPASRPPEERFYPFHSGALAPDVYRAARDELLDRLEAQVAALGLDAVATVDLPRTPPSPWPDDAGAADSPGGARAPERLVAAYGRALLEAGGAHPELVVLDADLMIDLALEDFRDRFPDRFLECGIAEQDMVSQASGLAAGGMLPVVHSFATFLSARPMEQAVNVASEHRRVWYVAALAGLVPAAPGHSHQGLQDIGAFTRADAMVIAPASERAVADAVHHLVTHDGSVYLRLCSMQVALPFDPPPLAPLGEGTVVAGPATGDRAPIVVLAYGPVLLGEAVRAVRSADLEGLVRVVDVPWVNAVDGGWLHSATAGATDVVVLDDHDPRSGLGAHVALVTAGWEGRPRLHVVGVDGVPHCGAPGEVLAAHGLDRAAIAARLSGLAGQDAARSPSPR
jgi:transketolase